MSILNKDEFFLSHPYKKGEDNTLVNHSLKVADSAIMIAKEIRGISPESAFITGLMHDFGKLNHYYQDRFKNDEKFGENGSARPIVQVHSAFSNFIAKQMIKPEGKEKKSIMRCIDGHHGILKKLPYCLKEYDEKEDSREKVAYTIDGIKDNLPKLLKQFEERRNGVTDRLHKDRICEIKWLEFSEFDSGDSEGDEFLNTSILFSILLQSDRGSFYQWKTPKFNESFDTRKMVKKEGKLSDLRKSFGEYIFRENKFEENVLMLEAPTGIGKTRIFLEIVNQLKKKKNIERVFYFSPLLALTEDFEGKLESSIKNKNEVTIYNHIYKGTLDEKTKKGDEYPKKYLWDFEIESFNKSIVITTTQRLIMTLFSNYHKDKIKLASFKNSILIIDEIQTMPREILPMTIKLLKNIAERANSTIILVSATVPEELNKVRRIRVDETVVNRYLDNTLKLVKYCPALPKSDSYVEKTLKMFNTRKKAYQYREQCNFYMTSGIRKKDRKEILNKIKKTKEPVEIVSTQVIEAGVDISFKTIFRELAPLDNIVQVMGRLNREADDEEALLIVFNTDNVPTPYGNLEYKLSKEFFEKNTETTSRDIYEHLKKSYYPELNKKNLAIRKEAELITKQVEKQEYEKVWETVRSHLGMRGMTAYIPDSKEQLNSWLGVLEKQESAVRDIANLEEYGANFPYSEFNRCKHLFDERFIDAGLLIPKEENINLLYDAKTGLDKWFGE